MGKIEIERISKSMHECLFEYLKKTFPDYSDEYISYSLNDSIDYESDGTSFVVLNNGKIVGCHMFYNTKACINGQIVKTRWGHDTFIDEECRKECSVPFILTINKVPAFGIGVTEANKKIQESIRTLFIEGLFTYITPTIFSLLGRIAINKRIKSFKAPNIIKKGAFIFEKINNADVISYKNDGFWYNNLCNVDFVRDADFIRRRFLENHAFQYHIYTCHSYQCYFVVRPIIFHGIPVLLLVDFRYDIENPQIINYILKTCLSIALNNKLGGVVTMSNDVNVSSFFARRISLKKGTTLVANKYLRLKGDIVTNVTAADADVDYMYNH